MSDPLAGWYQDPSDTTRERWWDGQVWTDQTRDSSTAATSDAIWGPAGADAPTQTDAAPPTAPAGGSGSGDAVPEAPGPAVPPPVPGSAAPASTTAAGWGTPPAEPGPQPPSPAGGWASPSSGPEGSAASGAGGWAGAPAVPGSSAAEGAAGWGAAPPAPGSQPPGHAGGWGTPPSAPGSAPAGGTGGWGAPSSSPGAGSPYSGAGPATPGGYGSSGADGQWPQRPIDTHWNSPAAPPGSHLSTPPPSQPSGRNSLPWIIGGAVAVLAVLGLIAAGLAYLNTAASPTTTTMARRPNPSTTRPTLATTVPPTSAVPAPTTTDPNADPTDPTTRLAYKRIGAPWTSNVGSRSPFGTVTAGERTITQAQTPAGGSYVAEVQVYPFIPPPANPSDLAGLTKHMIDEYTAAGTGVYPDPHQRHEVEAKDLTVSGRKGYVSKGRVTFDVAGYEAKGESYAAIAVDTPEGLACVFVSIPENRQDLIPVIDHVINTLYIAP